MKESVIEVKRLTDIRELFSTCDHDVNLELDSLDALIMLVVGFRLTVSSIDYYRRLEGFKKRLETGIVEFYFF